MISAWRRAFYCPSGFTHRNSENLLKSWSVDARDAPYSIASAASTASPRLRTTAPEPEPAARTLAV